ncbi:hypothetical protein [Sodalis sp. dw_96]|uniref:hypothetical protein n=1 Tax=Sodalis sp. dw_96 TaxID=2719794 RepID=UPI001BD2018E|nr:hypothetical protein [Sodalis sp. dw_96]
MSKVNVHIQPVVINRETIQAMLGGISRTTFWRKRQKWAAAGTPFPDPAPDTNPAKGGEQYRYSDVIKFCKRQGLIDEQE